jgi:hypothetical protein
MSGINAKKSGLILLLLLFFITRASLPAFPQENKTKAEDITLTAKWRELMLMRR